LLIADEPTTALDLRIQGQILELLRRITDDGTGLLLITHDLAVVAGLVERTVVMYDGRVVEEAPTSALFESPLHPYTRLLLRRDDNERRGARPSVPKESTGSGGCRFAPRCALAEPQCRAVEPELQPAGTGRHSRCPVVLEGDGDA